MNIWRPLVLALSALLVFAQAASAAKAPRKTKFPTPCSEGQRVVPVCAATRVVTSAADLVQVLRAEPPFKGCVVIPKDSSFDLTGQRGLPVRSGVSLVGERGELCSRPTVFTKDKSEKHALFTVVGDRVEVRGIHFLGPQDWDRSSEWPYVNAVQVDATHANKSGFDIVIEDNEMDQWTGAGVYVFSEQYARNEKEWQSGWIAPRVEDAGEILITHNFMHHNAREGGGYGVNVSKSSYATVLGNVFDYNRHAIASDGLAHTGYVARFNYVLQGGYTQGSGYYNQHFDVHGTELDDDGDNSGYGETAGEYYEIAYNTFRGEQGYYVWKTRPAFMLRGKSTIGSYFDANVCVHDNLDGAVALKMESGDSGWGEDHAAHNFFASGNSFDTDYSGELATGDFDGDGRTDVFVANGTAWWFSSGGVGEWIFLHASNKRTSQLGFADINNDGVTDILYRDGSGNVGWLNGGRAALAPLTTSPVAMADMRFGDFNGDKKTDIFYTHQKRWWIWYGGSGVWTTTQSSVLPISELRFGEFDSVPGTDVVASVNSAYSCSSGAATSWSTIGPQRSSSLAGMIAADFDGDGTTDLAYEKATNVWVYSKGARSAYDILREAPADAAYPSLKTNLVGKFDGDARVEVITWWLNVDPQNWDYTNYFAMWRGDSPSQPFQRISNHGMR